MPGTRYHVASCCNPHGETFTRKRQAVRIEKELNRDLRDESGARCPTRRTGRTSSTSSTAS